MPIKRKITTTAARTRRRNGSDDARELLLYIESDSGLYRQMLQPIQRNLATKRARGVYSSALAVKAFRHLADAGAKKYAKEFADYKDWPTVFSVADRNEVAKELRDHFEVEAELGNYDNLLPKKYQGWGGGKKLKFGEKNPTLRDTLGGSHSFEASEAELLKQISRGDRVTIVDRFGQSSTGTAVMLGPGGWVLNMGGKHGTPGIASASNITKIVKKGGKR